MEPREAAPLCSPAKTQLSGACAFLPNGNGQARVAYRDAMSTAPSPWYVWVVSTPMYFPPPAGCADLSMPGCSNGCAVYDLALAPPACQCAETFNCACLWASQGPLSHDACEMIAGQPVVARSTAGAPDGSLP